MLSTIEGLLTRADVAPVADEDGIVIYDWGFSEFPHPGDIKKHTLPIFVDPEEESAKKSQGSYFANLVFVMNVRNECFQ